MPEPSFKLRQILFEKDLNVQLNFWGLLFHLNIVSKILREELKTTSAGDFIRCFKVQGLLGHSNSAVDGLPSGTKGYTSLCLPATYMMCPSCYSRMKYKV